MKVLLDYHGIDISRFGGVALYTYELLRRLPNYCSVITGFTHVINQDAVALQGIKTVPVWMQSDNPKLGLNKLSSALCWRYCRNHNKHYLKTFLGQRQSYDLWHVTWDVEPWCLPFLEKKPFVYTVHDCIPELFGYNAEFLARRRLLATRAARIIAVSENTKCDCVKFWQVPEGKIDVVYHAASVSTQGDAHSRCVTNHQPYILFVGKRAGYKNFEWFVKGLAPLLRQRPSVRLVCTGMPFNDSEKKLLNRLCIQKQTEALFVEREAFSALYRGATVFVYPSKYEGFGMPILDAFHSGCPVLLANRSCFPEIGADSAAYFDENDEVSLVNSVTRFLDDDSYRRKLIEKGYMREQFFSWQKSAMETYVSYEKALRGKGPHVA